MSERVMIVHLQTVVKTTFAIVGEDGEISDTRSVASAVRRLDETEFTQLLENLRSARAEIRNELEPKDE